MKKLTVIFLCAVLALGSVSACGKSGADTDEENNAQAQAEQEDKTEESKTEESKTEESQINGKQDKENKDNPEETDKEQEKTQEESGERDDAQKNKEEVKEEQNEKTDMSQDLTMQVLKQAGTVDYTSLEELNPVPGSHIAVVVKNTKSAFWQTVKKGMTAAVKDLNEKMGYKGEDKVKLSFEGPTDELDVESQINTIDAVLAENPSVLCLSAIDMESCSAQLEEAMGNEIPVVILDSGVESDLVNTICTTDNYAAGAEAAKKMAEAVGNKGQIAVMAHAETSKSSQDREKGFTEEITKNHPEIEIVNISHENGEHSMAEMAEAVLVLYPELKGYYCTNEFAANDVLDIVKASGKEISIIGFDAGKKQIGAVKEKTELGTFVQNPYGMGYATVIAGVRADLGLENDKFINTGYQWIDSTNVNSSEYANYLYE